MIVKNINIASQFTASVVFRFAENNFVNFAVNLIGFTKFVLNKNFIIEVKLQMVET